MLKYRSKDMSSVEIPDDMYSMTLIECVGPIESLKNIKKLYLESVDLEELLIPSDHLELISLNPLCTYNNYFDFTIFPNLKELYLNDLGIEIFDWKMVPPSLRVLCLNDNPLSEFEGDYPVKLERLYLENVNLPEKPNFKSVISYSYDTYLKLKYCHHCIHVIENLQPYYNKNNDSIYLCECCYDSEQTDTAYEKKINVQSSVFHCDCCGDEVIGNMFFEPDPHEVHLFSYENQIMCEKCYLVQSSSVDLLLKTKYDRLICNKIYEINGNELDFAAPKLDLSNVSLNQITRFFKSKPQESLTIDDVKGLIRIKQEYPKFDISFLQESLVVKIFDTMNLYLIEYIIKHFKISLKNIINKTWEYCVKNPYINDERPLIFELKKRFPLFLSKNHFTNNKSKEINGYIRDILLNDDCDTLMFIEELYDHQFKHDFETTFRFDLLRKNATYSLEYLKEDFTLEELQDFSNDFINNSSTNDINETFVETLESVFHLSEDGVKFDTIKLNTKVNKVFQQLLHFGESLTLVETFYKDNKRKINYQDVPKELFLEVCKDNNLEFATFLHYVYENQLILDIRNNEIIDYGIDGKGLYKKRNFVLKSFGSTECSICMDSTSEIITKCGHMFCKMCIKKSLDMKNECPYCRSEIQDELYYI